MKNRDLPFMFTCRKIIQIMTNLKAIKFDRNQVGMIHWITGTIMILLLILPQLLAAQPSLSTQNKLPDDLNPLFDILAEHSWDKSYDTLRLLDSAVIKATEDEKLREALEVEFIDILQSSRNDFAVNYACRQLYLIGSSLCIPAVSGWLTDPELSHMARYALANIDDPLATEALRKAAGETSGTLKAGLIQSLAKKGGTGFADEFAVMIDDPDKVVALAAVRAIGLTGNSAHLDLLRKAGGRSPEFYIEACDAELMILERMVGAGDLREAGKSYRKFYEKGKTPNARMAGLKGMIACGVTGTEKLLLEALSSEDPEIRGFAGRLISDPNYMIKTGKLAGSLKKLSPEGRIALIDAFGSRGAVDVKEAILVYGDDPDPEIQLSVVRAVGKLGGAGDIAFLARKAAGENREISNAALISLSTLKGDSIDQKITSQIHDGEPAVQAALIRSLTARSSSESKKEILSHLNDGDERIRKAVLDYLKDHGDEKDLPILITFMEGTKNRSEERLASRTLTAICGRYNVKCETAILSNLENAEKDLREILVENLNLVNTAAAREQCIKYTRSEDPDIRKTAVRTLASWQDTTAIVELKNIMENNPDQSLRILAFRGYFRLFRNTSVSDEDKMREYSNLIQSAERKEEKLMVLSAFPEIGGINAMKRIEKYLYDKEISRETCLAILSITDFLDSRYKSDIAIAMMQIMQVSNDENVLADVERRFSKYDIEPSLYFDPVDSGKQKASRRIVFISGPMDHAWYGAHEYPKDLLFLKKCMENSPDLKDLDIDFILSLEKPDLERIRGADAIVVHSSADRAAGEVHALFPNFRKDKIYTAEEKEYYRELDKMVSGGMGVVILHYAVWTDFPESRDYMSKWVGGYYDDNISKVRMTKAQTSLESPSHPVCRGVHPWNLLEEYYINQVYSEKELKFIPLMAARVPLEMGDEPAFYTMGWAVQRRDGGRGIGYTGCHSHDHLYNEDYRKFVVNAIAWSAGIRIPENGIRTEIPEGWEK